jgi:hypothetical protein
MEHTLKGQNGPQSLLAGPHVTPQLEVAVCMHESKRIVPLPSVAIWPIDILALEPKCLLLP